jgi:hypothetical protein
MAAIANVETAFAQRDSQDIVLHDIKSRAVLGGGFEDRLHRQRDARIGTRARIPRFAGGTAVVFAAEWSGCDRIPNSKIG